MSDKTKYAQDYMDLCGHPYNAPNGRFGHTSIYVLDNLTGKPWNNVALGYVHSLRPSSIRVTTGEITCDARAWRVTVFLDIDGVTIQRISQEVEVWLPDGVAHGLAMDWALQCGVDSPQVRFFDDRNIDFYQIDQDGRHKVLVDGSRVPFPVPKENQT
ncbi:hypothetical protein [Rosistilla oblonga]|uniref:hypothetical protein n=1 Tax=Rosistilla oblonga TaxID=2527990 RepID=UPI003A97E8A0